MFSENIFEFIKFMHVFNVPGGNPQIMLKKGFITGCTRQSDGLSHRKL